MKKFVKVSAVMAALVLALACFAACSDDDDDDDDGPAAVTTWEMTESGTEGGVAYKETTTVLFYESSFEVKYSATYGKESVSFTQMKGTYDGDTKKDGIIKLTATHVTEDMLDKSSDSQKLVAVPAEQASEWVFNATISGTTLEEEHFGTFTKK